MNTNSGTHKGTVNRNEPDDLETAYFVPSWHSAPAVIGQSVAIAPLSNRETSIIFTKVFTNDRKFSDAFIHFVFTEEETQMIIDALFEVQKRWETGKVIK